jgi:hypothetical protein
LKHCPSLGEKDILIYTSNSTSGEKGTILNANEYWKQFKVVIFTPVVNIGVEFNVPDYFHSMFGIAFGENQSALPASFMQMLRRVRHLISKKIYVYFDGKTCKKQEIDIAITYEDMVDYIRELFTTRNVYLYHYLGTRVEGRIDENGIWSLPVDDPMTEIAIYSKILRNKAIKDYIGVFTQHAVLHGGRVQREEIDDINGFGDEFNEMERDEKEEITCSQQEAIAKADESSQVQVTYTMGTVAQNIITKQSILSFFGVLHYHNLPFKDEMTEEEFFAMMTPQELYTYYMGVLYHKDYENQALLLATGVHIRNAWTKLFPIVPQRAKKNLGEVSGYFNEVDAQVNAIDTGAFEYFELLELLMNHFEIEGRLNNTCSIVIPRASLKQRATLSEELLEVVTNKNRWSGYYLRLMLRSKRKDAVITNSNMKRLFQRVLSIMNMTLGKAVRRNNNYIYPIGFCNEKYPIILNYLLYKQ